VDADKGYAGAGQSDFSPSVEEEAAGEMTNDEIRMTKEIRMTNDEISVLGKVRRALGRPGGVKDAPVPPGGSVRAYHHLLGETGISFFGSKQLAAGHKKGFPQCLDGAPMLLPLENLTLRRLLNQWFERNGIQPKVVAEFEDSALLQVFGADGVGIFAAPSVVEPQVIEQYGVQVIGRTDQVRERFYAISGERRIKNPAVVAICDIARHSLFGRK